MYKPEGYKDAIEGLKGSKNTLYIATIGVYNKKLDEGDIRNYLNEIFIGVAVVAAIVVVIATGGVGAIMGALGLQALTGASAVIATGIVGIGYGAAVGLGVGAATGRVGYFVNTSFGDGNYAMDGTYMTEDTKANMFNQYVSSCAKAGMKSAAGASAAWIVETAWDAGDMLKAIFSGDKIAIFAGVVSLLFSGDDIIKGVKYMDEVGGAGKNIGKNLDGAVKGLDDVYRLPEIEIQMKRNPKHDEVEFGRQASNQNDGMNKLSLKEYKENRAKYIENGRPKEASKIQQQFRKDAYNKKVIELRKKGLSLEEAETSAKKWMSDKAVLHDPDMVAGGYAENVTGLGNSKINSSLGSQWKNKIDLVDQAVDNFIKNNPGINLDDIYLNVKLTY